MTHGAYVVEAYLIEDGDIKRWSCVYSDDNEEAFENAAALLDIGRKFYTNGCVFLGCPNGKWIIRQTFGRFPTAWDPTHGFSVATVGTA